MSIIKGCLGFTDCENYAYGIKTWFIVKKVIVALKLLCPSSAIRYVNKRCLPISGSKLIKQLYCVVAPSASL